MKTAISLDDGLLLEADETARQLGLSRSRLFSVAVREFLERHRQRDMLHRLNEVYGSGPQRAEKALLTGIKSKVRRTVKESW
jgi:metal-responsive CopG/Arc/MetJ family transcriptional regulator